MRSRSWQNGAFRIFETGFGADANGGRHRLSSQMIVTPTDSLVKILVNNSNEKQRVLGSRSNPDEHLVLKPHAV